MPSRLLHRLAATLFFIAASALWTSAIAQLGTKTTGQGTSVVTTPYVRAELLAHAPQGVAPGQPLWLGLQITHQPEWHTYWKNPGDSGLPTQFEWKLPEERLFIAAPKAAKHDATWTPQAQLNLATQ